MTRSSPLLALVASSLVVAVLAPRAHAQAPAPKPAESSAQSSATRPHDEAPLPDLAKVPTLFVVAYAHLDTEWRWCYPQTIREYVPATLNENFRLFEKHPSYVFNFSGSRRYQMMREYYPEGWAKLKEYVASGNWFPCGSSVDENDANVPSAESYVRHVLYGNRFFRRELGVASDEFMLPDCFGFPASLPSLLAHCGVKGFSTQKLTWNSAVPIPFKVGVWKGPDGRSVIAALDPGSYGGEVLENLATSEGWSKRIDANGKASGVYADYHYYGTGDRGGSPTERSVEMVERSLGTEGPVKIVAAAADALVHAITPEMRAKLPTYQGELQLTEHSAGSITSEAFMKRMNRKNELLADAAERAAVAAAHLGGRAYPKEKLEAAWTLVLGSQMHDILPGTSHPYAYDYAWNDELLAANQFAAVLTDSVGVVASAMDTNANGTALVVYNPVSVEREDVVEADVPANMALQRILLVVTGPDGAPVPAQIVGRAADTPEGFTRIAFLAKVPSVGFATYDARITGIGTAAATSLKVDEHALENERYVVTLDAKGDIASIQDKQANKELLSAPARLELCYENPQNWPAWNQDWADRQLAPKEIVGSEGTPSFRVVEHGPARVAVEVTRTVGSSTFVQTIRLASKSARVEVVLDVDWAARERSLRASFPLTVKNATASYDLQTGVLERPNRHAKQFEYAHQQWMGLTDVSGHYGVSILNDSKYGSDKPDDSTLRLTLLHTPGTHGGYEDQGTQDVGRHRVLYAIEGHALDWRKGRTPIEAAKLNQPLVAFRTPAHAGKLGKSWSLLSVDDPDVLVSAVKQAEDGDELVVRLREIAGGPKRTVKVRTQDGFRSAREVDGQEREIGKAALADGAFAAEIAGYELRAIAASANAPTVTAGSTIRRSITLPYDLDAVSTNANRADGELDANGDTLPAEQLFDTIVAEEATFHLGKTMDGAKNAVTCRGQELQLPAEPGAARLYLLAASSADEARVDLSIDGKPTPIVVRPWTGFVGAWDRREWIGDVPEQTFGWTNELSGIVPGAVHHEPVAWFASHHHTKGGDTYYRYAYLYKIGVDLPAGAKSVKLPNDERVKVFAACLVRSEIARVEPATPLYDTLADHRQDAPRIARAAHGSEGGAPIDEHAKDSIELAIEPRVYFRPGAIRYTLDGSKPTATSPAYAGPFWVHASASVNAAIVGANGELGPTSSARVEVSDATPPSLAKVELPYGSKLVRVTYSEPVGDSAASPTAYAIDSTEGPKLPVLAARRGPSSREIVLELADAPKLDTPYRLTIDGVRDASPAKNAMPRATADLRVDGPVFELAAIPRENMGASIRDVPNLPVKAGDAWTLNVFVRVEKQVANRTILCGFGRCEQTSAGVARYFAKFGNGIQFWSHNRDVLGNKTQLELGTWQMLTATYDGTTLRLYRDATKIGERAMTLADDENVVNVAPIDPWENERRFEGELRDLTIWRGAFGPDALKLLLEKGSKR